MQLSRLENAASSEQRIAAFVRGYFVFLQSKGVDAALLHGWENDFEGEISDIDYTIDDRHIKRVTELVSTYCHTNGWRLCQVLRHETTAAFCVCSAIDDPVCSVALDACSHYKRNGTVFIKSDQLLEDRVSLPWGGFCLSAANELKYRLIKAVAKSKKAIDIGAELAAYDQTSRDECEGWLKTEWGFTLKNWLTCSLDDLFSKLNRLTSNKTAFFKPSNLTLKVSRIAKPTGLVVCSDQSERLREVFGRLYFRKTKSIDHFTWKQSVDLLKSTMIVVPKLSKFWKRSLPQSCWIDVSLNEDLNIQIDTITEKLHLRCMNRENLI